MTNKFKYLVSTIIGKDRLGFIINEKSYVFNVYFKGLINREKTKALLKKSEKWIPVKDANIIYDKFMFLIKLKENNNDNIGINNFKLNKKNEPLNFFVSNNYRFRELLENNRKKSKQIKNIYFTHIYNVNNRKISDKLESPHYFFSAKYNEQNNLSLSQTRHWYSSNYFFIAKNNSNNNFIDIYTNKLINMFFSIKYINSKNPVKRNLNKRKWRALKIKPDISFIMDINNVMKYTSNRINMLLNKIKLNDNNSNILKNEWVKKKLSFSNKVNKLIHEKITKLIFSRIIKEENYISILRKPLLSKPLYKHTSFNIIIDLFIFNNKTYKFNKLENLLLRRSLYKYMYSMYVNCGKKIGTSIQRPRFFYINLIEPKIQYYYSKIIEVYGELLFKNKKNLISYLWIILLELDFTNRNKIKNIRNIFEFVKSLYNNNNISKESGNMKYSIEIEKVGNRFKRDVCIDKQGREKKIKVFPLRSKSELQRKYLLEIEEKNNISLDENKLTLWNNKGLEIVREEKKKKHERKFRQDKFSYIEFKKKNSYDIRGKKISPKVWKKKLMNYYLFSQMQKKNTNRNVKIFNKYLREQNLKKTISEKVIPSFIEEKIENNYQVNMKYVNKNKNNLKKINIGKEKKSNINFLNKFNSDNRRYNKELNLNGFHLINSKDNRYINGLFKSFYLISPFEKKILNNIKKERDYLKKIKEFSIRLSKKTDEKIKNKRTLFSIYSIEAIHNQFTLTKKTMISKSKKEIFGELIWKCKEFVDVHDLKDKIRNSSYMWGNLNNSLIETINDSLIKKINDYENKDIYSFFNVIRDFKNHGNLWYLMYFFNYIKKEFDIINLNVIGEKKNNMSTIYNESFRNNSYLKGINKDYLIEKYIGKMGNFSVKYWSHFFSNNREEYLIYNINYNEKLFKPYYKFILPKYIMLKYVYYLNWIGYKYELFLNNESKIDNNNKFIRYTFTIFNFVLVKIMFDLLRYNYRYLIRLKSKYYFLNKIKLYESKYRKSLMKTWLNSFDYLKRLRNTPLKFWKRYDKLTKFYLKQIFNNASLDTNKRIFIPFVIYFEDILFNLYGKSAIIRLWPLKRLYLSSFILAGRILSLILWRHKINSLMKKHNFHKITYLLMNTVRLLQINRAYDYYIKSTTSWPNILLKILNKNKSSNILNYSNSGYYSIDKDRNNVLQIFSLKNSNLFNYISLVKYNYKKDVHSLLTRKKTVKNDLKWKLKSGKISTLDCAYLWLRPLNSYFLSLKRYLDITGIRFILSGKAGNKSNNARSFYRTKYYGNLIGPWYTGLKTFRNKMEPTSHLRGEIMSHIDYTNKFSKSRNGAISLKIWISSRIGGDIHDLLLHIIRIKFLYYLLINKYYSVDKLFSKLRISDYSESVNSLILVKRKSNNKVFNKDRRRFSYM